MPRLERITIYPIKALDGVDLDFVEVLAGGALACDRQFAICDSSGNFWNAKRTARIHRLRAAYDLAAWTVRMDRSDGEGDAHLARGAPVTFHLKRDRSELAR